MMTVRVDVSPELLRWAVDRAGWNYVTTVRRQPRFESWVHGGTRPTLKQLEDFAAATHAPLGQLFLPEPPAESIPIPDMRTVGNIRVPQPSADLLDTIYLCQERQDWYRDFALVQGLAPVPFVGTATVAENPRSAAAEVRKALELPDGPVTAKSWSDAFRLLSDRIEDAGALVMVNGIVGADTHRKLNPREFRGFALTDPLAPVIFVNGADTKAAQIFTLIHELCHLWLGGSALSDAQLSATDSPGGDDHRGEELWCNAVAAEVLVPGDDLRGVFDGAVNDATLDALASRYRVSTLVVLGRLHETGLLSWETYRAAYSAEEERVLSILSEQKAPGGGNYYNTQPRRLSRRFASAVIGSTLEGSTPYRDGLRLLGTKKISTFHRLAEQLDVH